MRDLPPPAPLAALLLDSAPGGLHALDVWLKHAEAQTLFAGDVEPGQWLLVLQGELASLAAGWQAARDELGPEVVEALLLPAADGRLWAALRGTLAEHALQVDDEPALGLLRSERLLGTLQATDAALKAADVELLRLRLAFGLHGRGEAAWFGSHDAVLAANAAAEASAAEGAVRARCLPRPLPEVLRAACQQADAGLLLAPLRPPRDPSLRS